ncbi:MAG: peptidylprolyl isomerase [Chlorobi bacterium]|nr:peptidylprolyl isomerase [Chlorobiota bacterium]
MGFIFSCINEDDKGDVIYKPSARDKELALLKANKYLLKLESQDIDNYVRRHSWNMVSTGSGLRLGIVEKGSGKAIKKGELVRMDYETRLIDGSLVYSSENDGTKSFIVGHGGIESGLEEAVLLMHYGDEANIIIPSHLAFGLLGDQKSIPSHATLIYKVKILNN